MLREKRPTSNHGVHDWHVIKEHLVSSSKQFRIQNTKYVLLFNILHLSALYVDYVMSVRKETSDMFRSPFTQIWREES